MKNAIELDIDDAVAFQIYKILAQYQSRVVWTRKFFRNPNWCQWEFELGAELDDLYMVDILNCYKDSDVPYHVVISSEIRDGESQLILTLAKNDR